MYSCKAEQIAVLWYLVKYIIILMCAIMHIKRKKLAFTTDNCEIFVNTI